MLKTRIIPCLDVKDGRVVKGVRFLELRDAGDPVEAAKAYDAAGADELCFLDITASHEARGILLDVVSRTLASKYPDVYVGSLRFTVTPLLADVTRATRPALRAAAAAVVVLLLIAFANATALVIARLRARRLDFAIRSAIGATSTA